MKMTASVLALLCASTACTAGTLSEQLATLKDQKVRLLAGRDAFEVSVTQVGDDAICVQTTHAQPIGAEDKAPLVVVRCYPFTAVQSFTVGTPVPSQLNIIRVEAL